MSKRRCLPAIIGLLAITVLLAACGSDDPTTPPPATDTTAPLIVATGPESGEIAVSVDDSVFVMFSEAMDPTTAAGNVSLSSGTITGSIWYTDRVLAIGHGDWATGTEVTVTVGTGLADVAGNALAAAHVFSFWTETADLLLLASTPADGATGVNRDASILLVFSQEVQMGSLTSHVTISDVVTKAVYPYAAQELESGRYLLNPDATLPASSTLYVTVDAGLAASGGGATLQSAVVIGFTTGVTVDTAPPTVVSTSPANGSTSVSPDHGYFRLTFSEPIDPDSLEPSNWNFELLLIMEQTGISPSWSVNNTVLTVALPTGLPAGLPMEITFVGFRDEAGNAQNTPYTWTAKVAGSADYVPVVDGARYADTVESTWGVVGNPTPDGGDSWDVYLQLDTQTSTDFRMVRYFDSDFIDPTGDWEDFRKSASSLQWTGFGSDGGTKARRQVLKAVDKNDFDTPLTILPLPIAVGTWYSSTTVTVPGEGSYAASLQGRVLGKVDYPLPQSGGTVFYKDAWKVVRTMTVSLGSEPAFTQVDTVWYSATLGEVHSKHYETDHIDDEWYTEEAWRFPAFFAKSSLGTESGF